MPLTRSMTSTRLAVSSQWMAGNVEFAGVFENAPDQPRNRWRLPACMSSSPSIGTRSNSLTTCIGTNPVALRMIAPNLAGQGF